MKGQKRDAAANSRSYIARWLLDPSRLPVSPMRVIARLIEHPPEVPIERPKDSAGPCFKGKSFEDLVTVPELTQNSAIRLNRQVSLRSYGGALSLATP